MNHYFHSIGVIPAPWVRGELLLPLYGFSPKAVGKYRQTGMWREGFHYQKDPAGRYIYNRERIDAWLENGH